MFVVRTQPDKDYSVEFFHLKTKEKDPKTGVISEYYTGTECVLSSVPKGEKFSVREAVTEEKRVKVTLYVKDKFCRAMGRKAALDKLLGATYHPVKVERKGKLYVETVKTYVDSKFPREVRTDFWKEYFNKSSKAKLP